VGSHHLSSHKWLLSSLPLAAQGVVSSTLGAESPAYRVSASGARFEAWSAAQRLRLSFDKAGVQIHSGDTQVGLSLRAVGYGARLRGVGAVAPRARANQVIYARRGLSEWYRNGPLGLEQGFTIPRAPSGHPGGPLTLSMALSGNARAAVSDAGGDLMFSHAGGPSLRYGGLMAIDAHGRVLRSWLELDASRLLLRVDTRGARYPLRIDPFIEDEKLTAGDEEGGSFFGGAVALSENGDTALIGGPTDGGYTGTTYKQAGAAWVFTRTGTTWSEQQKLISNETSDPPHAEMGWSVALSADGNTALLGAGDNGSRVKGAAWVFTRSGSTWTEQQKLEPNDASGEADFGLSVALSADGDTALIGGLADDGYAGAAWVFTQSGGTWTQQGAKLTESQETGKGEFGGSVTLSGDGNTALIGGGGVTLGSYSTPENELQEKAWVFTRSGQTWTQRQTLTPDGAVEPSDFGDSVALSSDGSTALIGGPGDHASLGAAWVFTKSGETWSQQGPKLTGEQSKEPETFGYSVALSGEGNTALVGAVNGNHDTGAASLFTRTAGTWSRQSPQLTPSESGEIVFFGGAVALSIDASTALVGGGGHENNKGAAWVFAQKEHEVTCGLECETEKVCPLGGSCPPEHVPEHESPKSGGGSSTSSGTSTSADTGGSSSFAPTSTAGELALACTTRKLTLIDVFERGARVVLDGAAAKSLDGQQVTILFDDHTRAATAVIGAGGLFATTAPLPPAKLRDSNRARYLAEVGQQRSLDLKLTRRLILDTPTSSDGTVTLVGEVVPPLAKPLAPILVQQQTSCTNETTIEKVKESPNGHFRVSIKAPSGQQAVSYRLSTLVRENRSSTKGFATYSLSLPVALG
jgi:hypothetical protein